MNDSKTPADDLPSGGIETIGDIYRRIRRDFTPIAGRTAATEAEYLITAVLAITRSELFLSLNRPAPHEMLPRLGDCIQQRLKGTPLAYILNQHYFYCREFYVTRDVLIPRPETECLVEYILRNEPAYSRNFCDFGTGSGSISAVLLERRPAWHAVSLDISPEACGVARKNTRSDSMHLLCSDGFSALRNTATFDFIVSNPPYIARHELATLDHGVIGFEPRLALDGGQDGLDFYRILADRGRIHCRRGGHLYCEIGATQAAAVTAIFTEFSWVEPTVERDLAGRDRIIHAQWVE